MGVYYSALFSNPVINGDSEIKFADLHVENLHHQSANVLVRLICDGGVVAEHLNRVKPSGDSKAYFRIPDMRLMSGPYGFQVFTTITGHHPLKITVHLKDRDSSVTKTIGMDSFTEVDVVQA
ncbi:hypothetical protein [Paenibacillus sp. 481]|uniref:hypothetical protein n=1 Tax=Paenibacillus sp. 481 TaxID=2835869 RepID=UPI001E3162CD|nr:hypothetical protein [Paenibacillus sp. 481]UHA74482.1 hypothetical protein KIK04_05095 [Paenibacillus sp. 481]